jgi:adenosine deaminase
MQKQCLKCYEEINYHLPIGQEIELLAEIKRWLYEKLSSTSAEEIIDEVIAEMNFRKALMHIDDEESAVCRFCLSELIYEAVSDVSPAKADLFKHLFISLYAFEGGT